MIEINGKPIVKSLIIFALALICIHSVILIIYYIVDDPDKFGFVRMFDLDMERNVPTLFSSLLFAISALLFWLLGSDKDEEERLKRRYWYGLAGVFLFLSFDESAKIHENIGDYTERFIEASGFLYYPWVISYGILVLILAVLYFKFFWRMPRKVMLSFFKAAAIFLTGAVGFELLGAYESSLHGTASMLYSILYTIEESLEMFGLIYLISILFGLLNGKTVRMKSIKDE